jgi:hypothetical protein
VSEYQYYEFQAVDRPLTLVEQEEVASLSSRVEPHPWRAAFVYNYSDFPADEKEVLARYYDAMLYAANWGSRQLMFRFPKGLVDPDQIQPYEMETIDEPYGVVELEMMGAFAILNIHTREREAAGWLELEEGNLAVGEGFEPPFPDPESGVLPLDDPTVFCACATTGDVQASALRDSCGRRIRTSIS